MILRHLCIEVEHLRARTNQGGGVREGRVELVHERRDVGMKKPFADSQAVSWG